MLIAAGVLKRDGKIVSWRKSPNYSKEELETRLQKIEEKRQTLQVKREKLQDKIQKYIALCNLIKKNKKKGETDSEKIYFPLVVITTEDSKENSISVRSNTAVTDVRLSFSKSYKIKGEGDILIGMNLHKVNFRRLTNFLPDRELLKFVNDEV